MRAVAALRARARNPRTHGKKQIRKIADSIEKFGFVTPILIDPTLTVIAGHGRLMAAKILGLSQIPTLMLEHLSPEEIRAYVIADNQLASLAGWDRELLSLEIAELSEIAIDLDLTVTGFEVHDLDLLRDVAGSKTRQPDCPVPAVERSGTPISQLGDIWDIGEHRLLCGNALDPGSYDRLLGKELADLVVTDPPYNVAISGHVCGSGVIQHPEFVMASGEMTPEQFERFLSLTCVNLARFSRSGSLHFIFMDWRSIGALLAAGEEAFDELINIIVWVKSNGGMGTLYRSRHEMVALFKHGKRAHKNNVALGANGRYRTNVWEYPGANSTGGRSKSDLAMHPTVKNLDMITEAIRDVSDPNDVVLDAFGGSGTTLVAAERCGRKARLIELDPHYCDVIIRRAESEGLEATLACDGQTFSQVRASRSSRDVAAAGSVE
ncbi:DNA methyltransferase [Sphingomonas sp. LB-2]|uniref:site-specific DNA-methyltransferase n=1 Tax=Sphingomonas caeni TaxID=2984949 RepID=UPI00222F4EA9|nr:DNA methyltransferase [Sphingomonas caeni]MCW3848073.1 DNA methyltransferase [Sphingomonas caeni]